jgi:hypothetical protein
MPGSLLSWIIGLVLIIIVIAILSLVFKKKVGSVTDQITRLLDVEKTRSLGITNQLSSARSYSSVLNTDWNNLNTSLSECTKWNRSNLKLFSVK